MTTSRREFLRRSGLGLLTFCVAGCDTELSPAEARQRELTYRVLGVDEAAALDALANILVPGSAEVGLTHYIDHQLAGAASDCMLMIRYLGVPFPYDGFYKTGIAALNRAAQAAFSRSFSQLRAQQATELVAKMAAGDLPQWEGPPPGFFVFVVRSDAADVYYGTMQGFALLGTPYMAHIVPPSRWGE